MTTQSSWADRVLPRASIARKMMLCQVALITVLAVAVALVSYGVMRHSFETLAKGELHAQAEAMATLIGNDIEHLNGAIENLALHAAEHAGRESPEGLAQRLGKYAASFPELAIADEQGRVSFRMNQGSYDPKPGDLAQSQTFLESARHPNRAVIAPLEWSSGHDGMSLILGYRKTDAAGLFSAYLQASVPIETLGGMFHHISEDSGIRLVIVDERGVILFAPEERHVGEVLSGTDTSPELAGIMEAYHDSFDRLRLLGQESHVMYEAIPGGEWKLFIYKPVDEFYAPLRDLTGVLIIIGLFAIVLGGMMASLLGRTISQPISLLTAAASGIAEKGRISERVPWQSSDELGRLAMSFNKMLDQLEQSYELLDESYRDNDNIFNSMADALLVTTMEGVIVRTNQAAVDMLGHDQQALLGKELHRFIEFSGGGRSWPVPAGLRCGRLPSQEAFLHGREVDGIPAAVSGAVLCDARGEPRGMVFLAKDLGELRRSEERLNYLANYDPLTGLPNRSLFLDRVAQAITRLPWRDRHMAVLYLDLDRFKVFNDSLGHDAGDRLLKEVASRLNATLREGDTVARLGGDKYVVMLNDVAQKSDVSAVADKIIHIMSQPFHLADEDFVATTSIGVSFYPQDGEDPQSLLKHAETAMRRAKAAGGNTCCLYTDTMNPRAAEILRTENAIRRGLERGEFEAFYQPQVELTTGAIIGVEALVRWRHPDQGLIPPFKFLPAAEESGLIVQLGEQMLYQACRQALAWQQQGLRPISVSVNIADRQFKHTDLPALVKKALDETGLDPRYLDLELTEGILMDEVEKATRTLEALKALGVKISIDDFGTGYSSLAYLKRFALDKLKIDRSFIMDIPKDEDDIAITTAILNMGRSLGLEVIAEGVENQEQIAFLLSRGCQVVQGFHFSPPVPGDRLTEMLARGTLP